MIHIIIVTRSEGQTRLPVRHYWYGGSIMWLSPFAEAYEAFEANARASEMCKSRWLLYILYITYGVIIAYILDHQLRDYTAL